MYFFYHEHLILKYVKDITFSHPPIQILIKINIKYVKNYV